MYRKRFFSDWSIRYKMLLSFWVVVLVFFLIFGISFYGFTRRNITKQFTASSLEVVRQLSCSFDHFQNDIINSLSLACYNPDIQNVLRQAEEKKVIADLNYYTLLSSACFPLIMQSMAINEDIATVALYSLNPRIIPYHISYTGFMYDMPASVSEVEHTWLFEQAKAFRGKPFWVYPDKSGNPFFTVQGEFSDHNDIDFEGIAMCKLIKDLQDNHDLGMCVMTVSNKTVFGLYGNLLQDGTQSVAVLDAKGNLISGSGVLIDCFSACRDQLQQYTASKAEGYLFQELEGVNHLISFCSDNLMGWTVVYATLNTAVRQSILVARSYTAMLIIFCIVVSFLLFFLFSTHFTLPVQKLQQSMQRFQNGNFDEQLPVHSNDEFGSLIKGYNQMARHLNTMINQEYLSNIKLREAELNALQAQINPHFLYNTLDTILSKAERAKEEEIAEMIFCLSGIFRLSLNFGKIFTSVKNERELLSNYLYLQKVRFRSRLEYEVRIEQAMLDMQIPKLILQPFVENAVIHGLESRIAAGHILVLGYLEPEYLYFCISDDGVGIPPERLQELRISINMAHMTRPDPGSNHSGYAMVNVAERLRLAYGENYELKLFSRLNVGSCVEIKIPRSQVKGGEQL